MGILEIIAVERLGESILNHHSGLKTHIRQIEKSAEALSAAQTSQEDRQCIAAIVELCFAYDREKTSAERENILRTLKEIAKNETVEVPTETLEQWDDRLAAGNRVHAKLKRADERRNQRFLKSYFSLRAKAGLRTQAEVAKKAGLSRTHVTALESGEHTPQQKTLQKLATAFGVDVTELM